MTFDLFKVNREEKMVESPIDRGEAAAVRERIPFRFRPMLATLVHEPFHKDGWVYEEKYDGDLLATRRPLPKTTS
jgi:ATP-dependent DNA ligase